MKIRPQDAAGSSEFNGRTIYFCSKGCKQTFDANPAKYAGQSSGTRGG
ncbi:MAG: YHS domain-containing protein [Gemmatimonadota bacterium]|nr:YHS domain-containing protein [Gemmatimonadota bacterium]